MPAVWLCLMHFLISLYSPCRPLERQYLIIFKCSCGALVHLREIYPAGQFGCSHGDGEPECQALALPPHPGEWPARSLQQPRRKHCQGRWVGGGPCRWEFRFLFLFPVFTPCSIFIAIWLLVLFENLHHVLHHWVIYLWAILGISLVAKAIWWHTANTILLRGEASHSSLFSKGHRPTGLEETWKTVIFSTLVPWMMSLKRACLPSVGGKSLPSRATDSLFQTAAISNKCFICFMWRKHVVWVESKMGSYSMLLTYEQKSKPSFPWSMFQVFDVISWLPPQIYVPSLEQRRKKKSSLFAVA